jgi:hypothetical protein
MRNAYKILVVKPEWKRPPTSYRHNGRTALKWTLGKYVGKVWIGLIWLKIGTGGELL